MSVETVVEIQPSRSNNNNNIISLGCGLDVPLFDTRQDQHVFLVSKASRPSAESILLLINGLRGSAGAKGPRTKGCDS